MKRKIFEFLVVFLSFVVLFFLSSSISSSVWSSPSRQFNVTPDKIWLNWTNEFKENITIGANSSVTVEILNGTLGRTSILPYYGQPAPDACDPLTLIIMNASDENYTYTIGPVPAGNTVNVTIMNKNLYCTPGKYFGTLSIRNATNPAENLTINVTADIPILINNTLNSTTGIGSFGGILPANASTYQSFFFYINNESTIENSTGISIIINGWESSQDVDVFLFDSSNNLKSKSIRKSGTSEALNYNFLPPSSEVWEIRIFGNSTQQINYNGILIFTTLNITNTSDPTKQIPSINFGSMNVSNSKQINLTLKNEGNLILQNVNFSHEIFYEKVFNGNGTKNFMFLVPDAPVATKVKVSLNWTGESNYSFNLYDQNGRLVASSYNKHIYANVTNAMQEEYDETLSIGSAGFWVLEIRNNSASSEPFTAFVDIYVNSSKWISTNYTAMTFDKIGFENSSSDLWVNFSIPDDALDGNYKGYFKFTDLRGATIEIPFYVKVKTPMLLVEDTLKTIEKRVDENYGATLTKTLYLNLTNLGSYNLTLQFIDSGNLTCTQGNCDNFNGSFTYNSTSLIGSNSSAIIQVNLTFNSTMPTGIYEGWIYINATNETEELSSHPYSYFNVSLKLNLTNILKIKILEFLTKDCDNTIGNSTGVYSDENITLRIDIYYLNDTQIREEIDINNFTAAWLENFNVSWRIPQSGNLAINSWNGSSTPYCTGNCPCGKPAGSYYLNLTIPKDNPGGYYYSSIGVDYTRNDEKYFVGNSTNGTLVINNTGLYVQAVTPTSISVEVGSDTYFNATVKNYGPVSSSDVTIKFNDQGCGQITATAIDDGCGATESGYTFSGFSISYSNTCWFRWKIHGDTNGTCNAYVEGTPTSKWFNNLPVTVTVTSPPRNETIPILPFYVANLTFIQAEKLILVEQNSSNSTVVIVKNTGNKTQTFNFSIEGINPGLYTTNSTSASLQKDRLAAFLVSFSVGLEEIKDYPGRFKVNSSDKTETFDFTLRVLPGDANKTYVNDSLRQYEENMTQLFDKLNQFKAMNLTTDIAEAKLNNAKSKIEEAKNYTSRGDYFNAYQLLSIIKTLLEEAQTEISKLEQIKQETATEKGGTGFQLPQVDWLTVGLIVGGIGGALALAYLFWPTKTGYIVKKKKYVYKPPKKDVWESLKEKWAKLSKMKKEKPEEKE